MNFIFVKDISSPTQEIMTFWRHTMGKKFFNQGGHLKGGRTGFKNKAGREEMFAFLVPHLEMFPIFKIV